MSHPCHALSDVTSDACNQAVINRGVQARSQTSRHRLPAGERRREIFLERARTDHRQSDQGLGGETRNTSERRDGPRVIMGFPERPHAILNSADRTYRTVVRESGHEFFKSNLKYLTKQKSPGGWGGGGGWRGGGWRTDAPNRLIMKGA